MPVANFRGVVLAGSCLLFCVLLASLSAAKEPDNTTPQLTIQTSSLPRGFVHVAYRVELAAQNGITPYKWEVSSGTLPKGLSLTAEGVLEGSPAEAGDFRFVVTVADSAQPAQERTQELLLRILAPLLAKWDRYPKIVGQRIEGALQVSNQTDDDFDLTMIVVAVNDYGRATALGYQHFTLQKNTLDQSLPFGENLPTGSYQVNADVVGEVPALNRIYRAHLVTKERLQIVQQP